MNVYKVMIGDSNNPKYVIARSVEEAARVATERLYKGKLGKFSNVRSCEFVLTLDAIDAAPADRGPLMPR